MLAPLNLLLAVIVDVFDVECMTSLGEEVSICIIVYSYGAKVRLVFIRFHAATTWFEPPFGSLIYVHMAREVSQERQRDVDEKVGTAACDAVHADWWDCRTSANCGCSRELGVRHTEDRDNDQEDC